MPNNNEIIAEMPTVIRGGVFDIETALNKARGDTAKNHIRIIWDWWATKPQVRKNDATIRIITRTDIEELVRLMK